MIPSLSKDNWEERDRVLVLIKTQFSFDQLLHMRMLRSIYSELTRDNVVPATGEHWEVIGFQGFDPRADLNRFGGIMNVIQLLFFCSSHKELVRSIFTLSQDSYQHFPLILLSLRLTKVVLDKFLDGSLSSLCNKHGVLESINKLYVAAFVQFYDAWKRQKRSMKDFESTVKEVIQAAKKPARLYASLAVNLKFLDSLNKKSSAPLFDFSDMGASMASASNGGEPSKNKGLGRPAKSA